MFLHDEIDEFALYTDKEVDEFIDDIQLVIMAYQGRKYGTSKKGRIEFISDED